MAMTRRALLLGATALAAPAARGQALQRDAMTATERGPSFTSGGAMIHVDAFRAGPGRRPAVIMLHGADGLSANTQYAQGARAVAAAGYHVYLVHYLDRTQQRRATFASLFQNFLPWMETVRDAVAWVSDRPEVDPDRIGIIGISLGAALGLAVASADRRIKALVDYFGPLPQGALALDARLPPTLVLHGARDPIVPVANAHAVEALLRQMGIPHEVKIYPDQGHGFHGAAQRDATQRIVAFLERHLVGGRKAAGATALPAEE